MTATREFDDTVHRALFFGPGETISGSNSYNSRWSELIIAGLKAAGPFDNVDIDDTPPADRTRLWLDENTDPNTLNIFDTGISSWRKITFDDLFNGAAAAPPSIFDTKAMAEAAVIAAAEKAITLEGYTAAGDLGQNVTFKRVATEPTHEGKFRSTDRFLPNGSADETNGGWWEIVGFFLPPEAFGAVGDGTTDDRNAFHNLAAFLDTQEGGVIQCNNKVYNIGSEWTLPCGVDLIGPATLRYTENGGHGVFCSTNSSRLGQHTRIREIRFGRSGANGGSAIRTQDANAPFFTQSPYWDIQGCTFLDLDADVTIAPSPFTNIPDYGWANCLELHHSNGAIFSHNNVYGSFNPYVDATGQFESTGIRLGTNGTNGIIAVEMSHNRLWHLHTSLYIGEDVLAFWFSENECIKNYRGVYAPDDPLGDGTALQADTRLINNYITTATIGINLERRQLLHITGNHTNSDGAYFDNGVGFQGIRLANCANYTLRGNKGNLASAHASWGTKRAISLSGSSDGAISDHYVSRYFDDGVHMNGSSDIQFIGMQFKQLTRSGYSTQGTVRRINIGPTQYIDAEPTQRYLFTDASTDIDDLTIMSDEWVVPHPATSVAVSSNAITVVRKSHVISTTGGAETINTATGPSVRDGVELTLRASSSANALTVTDGAGGTGQFLLNGNFVSTNARDVLKVQYSSTFAAWLEVSRSDNQ